MCVRVWGRDNCARLNRNQNWRRLDSYFVIILFGNVALSNVLMGAFYAFRRK